MIAQWAIDRDLLAAQLLRLVNEASRIEPKDQELLDRIATVQAFRHRVEACDSLAEWEPLRQQWQDESGPERPRIRGVKEL